MKRAIRLPFFNSLRFKIGFGYVVLVAINITVTAWTIFNVGQFTEALDVILGDNYENVIALENMARAVERHEHAISFLLNRDMNNGKIEFTQAKDDFTSAFNRANERHTVVDAGPILNNIKSTYDGYLLLNDSLFQLVERSRFELAKAFHYNAITPFSQRLSDNCFWLIEENQKEMLEMNARTQSNARDTILAVLSAAILAIVLSVITMIQFTRRIIEPAERLTATVHQIGRGRLDLKTDVQTTDEIGELSREFNKMTERLRRFEAMNIEKIVLEKQKSEAIVGNISDAIIVCDGTGEVVLINRSAEEFLNVRHIDAVGKRIESLTSDHRIIKLLRGEADEGLSRQPYLQFNDQTYLHPRVSIIPSRQGGTEGVVLILQDVTQFKQLDKSKSDFMAMVSHELRTPVTSINIGVDILRQNLLGPLTRAQEELLTSFKQDCDRLTKLVREILQLSKLESGRIERRSDAVDVSGMLNSVCSQFKLQYGEKSVSLDVSVQDGIPRLAADEQQMTWVISNLLHNALRYTPPGGTVRVSARKEADVVLVEVKDTGSGIPEEFHDKIFDKFVQVKQPADPTPGSVGLGLAIAKEIIEMYDGKIWVKSRPNHGSTFVFTLPIARPEHA